MAILDVQGAVKHTASGLGEEGQFLEAADGGRVIGCENRRLWEAGREEHLESST